MTIVDLTYNDEFEFDRPIAHANAHFLMVRSMPDEKHTDNELLQFKKETELLQKIHKERIEQGKGPLEITIVLTGSFKKGFLRLKHFAATKEYPIEENLNVRAKLLNDTWYASHSDFIKLLRTNGVNINIIDANSLKELFNAQYQQAFSEYKQMLDVNAKMAEERKRLINEFATQYFKYFKKAVKQPDCLDVATEYLDNEVVFGSIFARLTNIEPVIIPAYDKAVAALSNITGEIYPGPMNKLMQLYRETVKIDKALPWYEIKKKVPAQYLKDTSGFEAKPPKVKSPRKSSFVSVQETLYLSRSKQNEEVLLIESLYIPIKCLIETNTNLEQNITNLFIVEYLMFLGKFYKKHATAENPNKHIDENSGAIISVQSIYSNHDSNDTNDKKLYHTVSSYTAALFTKIPKSKAADLQIEYMDFLEQFKAKYSPRK